MKILYWAGWSLTHLLGRLLFGIKISGREHIPKSGSFILASNHISYYDPPVVGSFIKRELFFFAKKELFDIALMGKLIWRTNARPVKRGVMDRDALKMSLNILKDGYGLTIFPEGTRSKDGQLAKPKPGIGLIARKAACPVVPAYLVGTDALGDSFWRRKRMSVRYGEPISAEWITSLPESKESYLLIAKEVMTRLAQLRDAPSSE